MSTAAASVTLLNLLLTQLTFGVIDDNFASVRLTETLMIAKGRNERM